MEQLNYETFDLLPEWYLSTIKTSLSDTEVNSRKITISRLSESGNIEFWVQVVKLFLGFETSENGIFKKLLDELRIDDETFPVRNNEVLVRFFAGCLLGYKIEQDDEYPLTHAISHALIIYDNIYDAINCLIPELPKRAESYLKSESVFFRQAKIQTPPGSPARIVNNKNSLPKEIPSDTLNVSLTKLSNVVTNTISDVKLINEKSGEVIGYLDYVDRKLTSLSEELNILWWISNEFSITINKPYSILSSEQKLLVAPFEFSIQTSFPIYLENCESHFYKLLKDDINIAPENRISEVILASNSQPDIRTLYDNFVKKIDPSLEKLVPILSGIKYFLEYGIANEAWKTIFEHNIKIDPSIQLSKLKILRCIYTEFMFLKSYQNSLL